MNLYIVCVIRFVFFFSFFISNKSMFLVSLAVADLLLVAVSAPLETMGYFLNPWTKGGRLCQLQYYVEMLSAVASVLNLTAVSLER